jgi:hypothetical protein
VTCPPKSDAVGSAPFTMQAGFQGIHPSAKHAEGWAT